MEFQTKENKSRGRDQGTPFLLSMCHGPSSLGGINPLSPILTHLSTLQRADHGKIKQAK